jgi:predicted kinase
VLSCLANERPRTYVIGRRSHRSISSLNAAWRAYAGAFTVYQVETPDRRAARKVVRLARALGYDDVRFWVKH